jgi:hypothetical protein
MPKWLWAALVLSLVLLGLGLLSQLPGMPVWPPSSRPHHATKMTVISASIASQSEREIQNVAKILEFQAFVASLDSGWRRPDWDTPPAEYTMVQLQWANDERESLSLIAFDGGGHISTGNKVRSLSRLEWQQLNAILAPTKDPGRSTE